MTKRVKLFIKSLLIVFALSILLTGTVTAAQALESATTDPNFIFTANGDNDKAVIEQDGRVRIEGTATPGYGFRANASYYDDFNLIDVKSFSTTFTLESVSPNISAVFSLQAIKTGTIGAGNGNGIHFLFRVEPDNKLAIAVYGQNEVPYWTPNLMEIPADKKITISFDYDATNTVTVRLGGTDYSFPYVTKQVFDSHYAENGYKGYYTMSSYYMAAPPATSAVVFYIDAINGKTPLENYCEKVEGMITGFAAAADGLNDSSTGAEISAVSAMNVFSSGEFKKLVDICIAEDATLQSALAPALEKLALYVNRSDYESVNGQINAFESALQALNENDADTVTAAIDAYKAIERDKINKLSQEQKEELNARINQLASGGKFVGVITAVTSDAIKQFEDLFGGKGDDVSSLADYNSVKDFANNWTKYKTDNSVTGIVAAADIVAFDARIDALKNKLARSLFGKMWTEGNTWTAEKSDLGLYVSGEGKYYETLGFEHKLQLDKTASIEFNIIYALRVLGSNHLHIGFYPATETGTKGAEDGVRVDFWFSAAGIVEIKPVNGRTEKELTTLALSLPDSGFFDMDNPDYGVAGFKVELVTDGDALVVLVNGLDIELDGLSPELFSEGCYLTVSSMSVVGADYNELLITNVGGLSYIGDYDYNYKFNNGGDNDPDSNLWIIIVSSVGGALILGGAAVGAVFFVRAKRKRAAGNKN